MFFRCCRMTFVQSDSDFEKKNSLNKTLVSGDVLCTCLKKSCVPDYLVYSLQFRRIGSVQTIFSLWLQKTKTKKTYKERCVFAMLNKAFKEIDKRGRNTIVNWKGLYCVRKFKANTKLIYQLMYNLLYAYNPAALIPLL